MIDTRSADTVVVTPDGQPVVIGGLMCNDKTSSDSKIPILGDIPVLGNSFQTQDHSDTKRRADDFHDAAHCPAAVGTCRVGRQRTPARRRSSPIRFPSRNWIDFWNACR